MKVIKQYLYWGSALVLLGSLIYRLSNPQVASYIYCGAALLFAVMQFLDRYRGGNFMILRLSGMQLLGAFALLVAGALMFLMHHNEWQVALAIAALLELYSAFRISHELDKEKREKH